VHHVLGHQLVGLLPEDVARAGVLAPLVDLCQPLLVAGRFDQGHQLAQHVERVPDDGQVHAHAFADLGGIDVNVHYLGQGGKGLGRAGQPVVKAGADANDQIGGLHGQVGTGLAMHTAHPQAERVSLVKGRLSQEGCDHGDLCLFHQLAQLALGRGDDNTMPSDDKRALGGVDHLGGLFYLPGVAVQVGLVAGQVDLGGVLELGLGVLDIDGDVDQHGAGAAGAGDVERLLHGPRQVAHVGDEIAVLDDGHGDARGIDLLKAIRAQVGRAYLAGDGHQWNRVHLRGGDARHQVGRPGP